MTRMIENLEEIINFTLEDAYREGVSGTLITNSNQRTRIAQTLLDYKENDNIPAGFDTFKDEWTDAYVESFPYQSTTDDEGVRTYKLLFNINRGGFLEGTSYVDCVDLPLDQCTPSGTCPDLGCLKGAGQSQIAEINMQRETLNVCQCLSDLLHLTGQDIYRDRLNQEMGLSVSETESIAEALAAGVLTYIERAATRRHIFEQYSDNGMVAIVESAGAADGRSFVVNNTDLLFFHHTYAVRRPTTGTECTPACYRSSQLIGFVQVVGVGNKALQTIMLGIAADVTNGAALPTVTLAAGDMLYALGGDLGTFTGGSFGGTVWNMYNPLDGVAAGQITGSTLPARCCNYNGVYAPIRLAYEIENDEVTSYMGLNVSEYGDLITPYVFDDCCGTDPATKASLTADTLLSLIERTESIIDTAMDAGWYAPILKNPVIVVDAKRFTMRQLKRGILNAYPSWNGQKMITADANGQIVVNLDPSNSLDVRIPVGKYPVVFREINKGLPEGMIRIGLKKPYMTAVLEGLKGTHAGYNQGNLVKALPAGLPDDYPLTKSDIDRYRATSVYYTSNACNPETMRLDHKVSRYYNRFMPLIGAETYVLNFDYTKPLDCLPVCVPGGCATCEPEVEA